MKNYQDVLDYWFEKDNDFQKWFMSGETLDPFLKQEYTSLLETISSDEDPSLELNDRLGKIILLDQFTRHIYRGEAKAFAYDGIALSLSKQILESGNIYQLPVSHQLFAMMPFQHSEVVADKDLLLDFISQQLENSKLKESDRSLYQTFLTHTQGHKTVLQQYGRYPKRNKALGRISTGAELIYIEDTKWRAY